MSMTNVRKEALERVSYIYYPVQFKYTNETQVQALVVLESEINAIYLSFAKQLGLPIRPRGVGARKLTALRLTPME